MYIVPVSKVLNSVMPMGSFVSKNEDGLLLKDKVSDKDIFYLFDEFYFVNGERFNDANCNRLNSLKLLSRDSLVFEMKFNPEESTDPAVLEDYDEIMHMVSNLQSKLSLFLSNNLSDDSISKANSVIKFRGLPKLSMDLDSLILKDVMKKPLKEEIRHLSKTKCFVENNNEYYINKLVEECRQ